MTSPVARTPSPARRADFAVSNGSTGSSSPAKISQDETLTVSSTSSSASAALARSLFIYIGIMFRRPSKLFRPSRVDTFGGLRQLAISANQTLSASFIRTLLSTRSGLLAVLVTLLPPLVVNTSLGFLLFTSHSFLALELARLPFFQRPRREGGIEEIEERLSLHTLLQGSTIIPQYPTLLSSIAGAGAGIIQGLAFTPIENVVRSLRDSAASGTGLLIRMLRLPIRANSPLNDVALPSTPLQAIRKFLSSDTWRKNAGWWSGWRWTVARDAVSYACFFAAFDISRRAGLRVKAFFGGGIQRDWSNFIALDLPNRATATGAEPGRTPTIARVAQATTIVTGGVAASVAAEVAGRPFKACQVILARAKTNPTTTAPRYPLLHVLKSEGIRPFVRSTHPVTALDPSLGILRRTMRRAAFRLIAVGPWGFGFLVWAWVGGEI